MCLNEAILAENFVPPSVVTEVGIYKKKQESKKKSIFNLVELINDRNYCAAESKID